MAENTFQHQTDTHLAKKYNDILYDCMLRCNTSGFVTNSTPHYDNLLSYYAAVNVLYMNCFMLFECINFNIPEPDNTHKTISGKLQEWSEEIESEIIDMKRNKLKQSTDSFISTFDKCKQVHKLIMYGFQKRNMLVRMSEKEPRGQASINYWSTKTAFNKGVLKDPTRVQKSEFMRRGTTKSNLNQY